MYEAAEAGGYCPLCEPQLPPLPAVMLAKRLIDEGKNRAVFSIGAALTCKIGLWIRSLPLTWHLRAETAGTGPHGDLNSHSIDLARFLVATSSRLRR
jgi:predicted dehydrogenase